MEQQNEMIIAKKLIWSTPGLTILPTKEKILEKEKRTNRKVQSLASACNGTIAMAQ
jgi:hypothetical protein